jgi:hypothetical protein
MQPPGQAALCIARLHKTSPLESGVGTMFLARGLQGQLAQL